MHRDAKFSTRNQLKNFTSPARVGARYLIKGRGLNPTLAESVRVRAYTIIFAGLVGLYNNNNICDTRVIYIRVYNICVSESIVVLRLYRVLRTINVSNFKTIGWRN